VLCQVLPSFTKIAGDEFRFPRPDSIAIGIDRLVGRVVEQPDFKLLRVCSLAKRIMWTKKACLELNPCAAFSGHLADILVILSMVFISDLEYRSPSFDSTSEKLAALRNCDSISDS